MNNYPFVHTVLLSRSRNLTNLLTMLQIIYFLMFDQLLIGGLLRWSTFWNLIVLFFYISNNPFIILYNNFPLEIPLTLSRSGRARDRLAPLTARNISRIMADRSLMKSPIGRSSRFRSRSLSSSSGRTTFLPV